MDSIARTAFALQMARPSFGSYVKWPSHLLWEM